MGQSCCCEEGNEDRSTFLKVASLDAPATTLATLAQSERQSDYKPATSRVEDATGDQSEASSQAQSYDKLRLNALPSHPVVDSAERVLAVTSPPTQPVDVPNGAFSVEVVKPADGSAVSKLGLVLYCTESTGRKLKVKSVRPGLIAEYNSSNPMLPQVVPEVTVISVNGICDPKGCADEMAKVGKMVLVLKKD
mmetsp:Transcript_10441/g.23641  ORF Transcript_10441/g.23641 Transcript_10441/m.23641 type:complete len:193 (-) Transcript_10441:73-651(-)